MSRLVSATRYPDTQEIEYITDDFCRIVHDERTGEWTLFRIPFPNDLMEASALDERAQRINILAWTAPIRYTPDAPRFDAGVMDESDE